MQVLGTPIVHDGIELVTTTERAATFFDGRYMEIATDMFTFHDGTKLRKNTAFLKALRVALVAIEYPTFKDVWAHSNREYSINTMKQNQMWIKKSGFVDDDCFGERFISEYVRRWKLLGIDRAVAKQEKADADMRHTYIIKRVFDYDNTMEVLRENRYVQYEFPEPGEWLPEQVDYDNLHTLQVITLHHVGGNPRVPIPLLYHYVCAACKNECDLPYEVTGITCDLDGCGGSLKRSHPYDTFKSGYASQVVTSDFNNIPIISLVEIPSGEFNAAVFIQKAKTGYYLFMIAVEAINIKSPNIDINNNEHAIWQIIRRMDTSHENALNKHIHGMEWYKACILLSYLANYQRHTSLNTLILGDGGSGKTSVARFYMATLTPQMKMQDAISLSDPGLYGSTTTVKVNDSNIPIPEAGLLSRYKMVCIDEVYEKLRILPVLRSLLRVANIAKEVAGNRTSMPKNASVVGTSNILPSVTIEQNKWKDKWIKEWKADQEHLNVDGTVNEFVIADAQAAMVEEWIKRDLDWHTGQAFPDMDRWAYIFLIKDPNKKLELYHLDASDMKIDDLTLSRTIYDHSVDNYFLFCSKIQVDWKRHAKKILEFVKELQRHDNIHSKRMAQDVTMTLTLSAQINGRAELIDADFDFVRELWGKTCEWVDVRELSHKTAGDSQIPQTWTIQTIKKHVHEYMQDAKGTHYYMSPEGFAMVASKLEDAGAPLGIVEDTIEHYRENPNQ